MEQIGKQQGILESLAAIDKNIKLDTSNLESINFTDVLSEYDSALKQLQEDYTKLKSDANVRPFTSYQLGAVQYDLGVVCSLF
ncbi:MAG: hypothetical protein APF81_11700 [Desulfosporosinus sp. BRH_c37]|nr:MAG: hypothetical protein APF81_11700 [Desulfosporosinus sp. BRH_c37]